MKKKTPTLNKIIPLVVYPFDVMISFNESDETLKKILRKKGVQQDEDEFWIIEKITGIGKTCRFKSGGTLIRLKTFPDSSFDYGTLQHEISHAVYFIMWSIGMPLEVGVSDEAYCYLTGYLTEQIMGEIGKTLRRKK